MNRRNFLASTAALTSLAALGPRTFAAEAVAAAGGDLLQEFIRANDAGIPALLAKQERRTGHRWLGGQLNEYGLHTAQNTSGFVSALTCAACAPGSKHYKSAELVEPLRLAIAYLRAASRRRHGRLLRDQFPLAPRPGLHPRGRLPGLRAPAGEPGARPRRARR
jgi:hypothetical protein